MARCRSPSWSGAWTEVTAGLCPSLGQLPLSLYTHLQMDQAPSKLDSMTDTDDLDSLDGVKSRRGGRVLLAGQKEASAEGQRTVVAAGWPSPLEHDLSLAFWKSTATTKLPLHVLVRALWKDGSSGLRSV